MALASKTVPQRAVGAARAGERRSTQSVACQANGRREALLAGAGAVVTAGAPALADDKPPENKEYTGAASPPVFRDRRKERESIDKGVYEPRRATANEKPRGEGESRFSFDKLSQKDTEERAAKSIERIENKVPELVDRKYWQDARNELRRQIGTLRFDLNNLADDKNLSRNRNKEIMQQLEDVDYFLRQKDQDQARQKLEPLRQQVNQLLS